VVGSGTKDSSRITEIESNSLLSRLSLITAVMTLAPGTSGTEDTRKFPPPKMAGIPLTVTPMPTRPMGSKLPLTSIKGSAVTDRSAGDSMLMLSALVGEEYTIAKMQNAKGRQIVDFLTLIASSFIGLPPIPTRLERHNGRLRVELPPIGSRGAESMQPSARGR